MVGEGRCSRTAVRGVAGGCGTAIAGAGAMERVLQSGAAVNRVKGPSEANSDGFPAGPEHKALRYSMSDAPNPNPPGADPPPACDAAPARPADAPRTPLLDADRLRGMVHEIKVRLGEIAQRELTLRAREEELDRRQRLLDETSRQTVRAEFDGAHSRLEQISADLNRQAIELSSRWSQLERAERSVKEREQRLDEARQELARTAEELSLRSEAQRGELEQQRQALAGRIRVVREREGEFERRLQLARDDLVTRRAELEQLRGEVEDAQASLVANREQFSERQLQLDRAGLDLQRRGAEIEQSRVELAAERAEVEERRREAQSAAREVEERRGKLTSVQHELERRVRELRETKHDQSRQAEALQTRARLLEQDVEQHAARARQLDQREQQLSDRADALSADGQRLKDLNAELEQRRATAEQVQAQAAEIERDALQQRDDALALREQVELREAESRQAALALEVERRQIEIDRGHVERAIASLQDDRQRTERQFDQARSALAERERTIRAAQRSFVAAPRLWWLRSAGIATVLGLASATAWLRWQTPIYRASAELAIDTVGGDAAAVAEQHRTRLFDARLLDGSLEKPQLVAAWRGAIDAGRARVTPVSGRAAVQIQLDDADAQRAAGALAAACEAYARRINEAPIDESLPAYVRVDMAWREQLETDRRQCVAQRGELDALLADLPAAETRAAALAEIEQMRGEHARIVRALGDGRSELVSLSSVEAPRGALDPADLEAALAADAVFQEDLKEQKATLVQLRTELAVGMLLMPDAAAAYVAAIAKFRTAVDEQRQLAPPPAAMALLEQTAVLLREAGGPAEELAARWQKWIDDIDAMKTDPDVTQLVALQSAVTEAARQRATAAGELVAAIRATSDHAAASSEGTTREVVVFTIIRDETTGLESAAGALAEAAKGCDPATNFRLDAQMRQLRGLRTRLAQRRESLGQKMQLDADRTERQEFTQRLEQTRERVRSDEQRRDELVQELAARLDAMRELDEKVVLRADLAARAQRLDDDAARLATQIAQTDAKIAEARRAGPRPDRVVIASPAEARLHWAPQPREAALLGAAVFAATWVVCLLLIARNPVRRRREEEQLASLLAGVQPEPKAG